MDWKAILQPYFNQPIEVRTQKLSTLWAGYGSVSRLRVTVKGQHKPYELVAKVVQPPTASGVSHERKIGSYVCEAAFYQHVAKDLVAATGLGLPVPTLVASSPPSSFVFVLSDLSTEYPVEAPGNFNEQQLHAALDWLACFHAYFWEQTPPQGVQPQGTYWYLDTRQEELGQMGRQWAELKALAPRLDRALKGLPPGDPQPGEQPDRRHRTLVHGDAKNENIVFTASSSSSGGSRQAHELRAAFYDFQYCGEGYGVRDVAYLLASSVPSSYLRRSEAALLVAYHSRLKEHLARLRPPDVAAAAIQAYGPDTLRAHFELALLDYVRFMAGWGLWGSGRDWAVERARAIMAGMKVGA